MHKSVVIKPLIKLFVSVIVLAALILVAASGTENHLRGFILVLVVILVFPITLLLGIDASKVIKREAPSSKSVQILGRILGFPQVIMGIILIGASLVYPIFGVHDLLNEISSGISPVKTLAYLVIAALSFGAGIHYLKEGLDIKKNNSSQSNN